MSEPSSTVPVVAAVVRRGDRYLVCRRPAHKRHGGLWEFPGGKVRDGETLAAAVHRELAEELGLETLEVGDVLFSGADEDSAFVIDFVDARASGTPVLHEHSDLGWFDLDALRTLPLAPADARFVVWLGAANS